MRGEWRRAGARLALRHAAMPRRLGLPRVGAGSVEAVVQRPVAIVAPERRPGGTGVEEVDHETLRIDGVHAPARIA